MLVSAGGTVSEQIRRHLSPEAFRIDEVDLPTARSRAPRTTRPDAIVLDSTGITTDLVGRCRGIREAIGADDTTPLVTLLDATAGREDRFGCLREGSWDVLTVPDGLGELALKLSTFSRMKRELDFAQATSLLDPPTQIYNTRGLLLRAEEVVAVAARYNHPLSCVVLGPSELEDAGLSDADARRLTDIVISTVRQTCRTSDLVGRLGPSQFAVIAPETGPRAAWQMVRRILLETDRRLGRERLSTGLFKAGYWSATNVQRVASRPVEILVNAVTALRSLDDDEQEERIRLYTPEMNGSHHAEMEAIS